MNWQPMLGYVEGARDLTDPALYASTLHRGDTLPAFAYRSKAFADLEDEKVWTRAWSCIGYAERIPNPGDLYPFTVGQHGVHVQRQPDSSLKAHFNFAQHGGCRYVPRQCQTGKKTSCFYTSCGHSRDRDVIAANADGSDTPEMYMFVGVNPLKLIPIHLETIGPLMFVNLDFDCPPIDPSLRDAVTVSFSGASAHRLRAACELPCNWKLAGKLMLEALHAENAARVEWQFPNLIIARDGTSVSTCLLQPVAMNATHVITDTFTAAARAADEQALNAAPESIARLKDSARALQRAIAGPDDPSPFLPQSTLDTGTVRESNAGVNAFNARLIEAVLTKHQYVDRPLFTQPGRSLNAGVNSGAF